jgi:hypothetical protein
MADHREITQEKFNKKYAGIYDDGWFPDGAVVSRKLPLADNYIVFSSAPDRAFISPGPPEVAIAVKGQREKWTDRTLQKITVCTSASRGGRNNLRVANTSGRNVHRQIRFEMPADEASRWREELIAALKEATVDRNRRKTERARSSGTAKCR